jgi:predicted aspartyl protease
MSRDRSGMAEILARGFAVWFCVAAGAPLPAHAADAPDCSLHYLARLDMRTNSDGTVTVPVKLGGRDVFFLIDTGGFVSTLDPHLADSMQLRPRTVGVSMYGVGGAQTNKMVRPEDFWIGAGLHASSLWFFLSPFPLQGGWKGSIAPEILRNYDVDFDFVKGTFSLFSQDHCPGKVAYWSPDKLAVVPMSIDPNNGHIEIPVAVDGQKMTATIDTGAYVSIMRMSAAKRYLNVDENAPGMSPQNDRINGKVMKIYNYPFKAINFQDAGDGSGVAVNNPRILVLQDDDMRHLGTDLVLGMGMLRQLHIYIAYKEGKMYLSPALKQPAATHG